MDIKSIYHSYLVHLESKRDRTKNKFHASSAGSCFRKQMYSYYDFPQDTKDDKSYRILRLGTIVHEDIENALIHYGQQTHDGRIYIEHEVEIEPFNLVGTFDVGEMIKDGDNVTFNLYDIKTAALFTWSKKFAREIKNRDPSVDTNYKMQLGTYALAINEKHDLDKINMYLVWYRKNDSFVRETLVNNKWIDKALEYWTEMNEILEESGKMFEKDLTPEFYPGVPFKPEWECGYCPYYSICPSKLADKRRK
jgi:CRISPR/Cas system-associated exonuclease Cas4 (RecB family)